MSSRRVVQTDRRAAVQLSAALLACLLALTFTAVVRSDSGRHHATGAKAVVGVSTSHVQYGFARFDQHAVADLAAASEGSDGVPGPVAQPVAFVAARAVDAARVRGPPGRAA